MTEIEIVGARPQDCARLSAIAQAAKAHWGYPEPWLEAWRRELTFDADSLRRQEVYVAWVEGVAQGVCALAAAGKEGSLEHLWVHPEAMGLGLGRRLFEHALGRARHLGIERIELWSDPNATDFYEHLGAVHVGDHHGDVLGTPRILPIYAIAVE